MFNFDIGGFLQSAEFLTQVAVFLSSLVSLIMSQFIAELFAPSA